MNKTPSVLKCLLPFTGIIACLLHVCLSGTKDSTRDVRMWKTMNALDDLALQEQRKMLKKFGRLLKMM